MSRKREELPRRSRPLPPGALKNFTRPKFLPDGRHFLLTAAGEPGIYVASLDEPNTRKLMEDGSSPDTRTAICSTPAEQLCSRGSSILNGSGSLEARFT